MGLGQIFTIKVKYGIIVTDFQGKTIWFNSAVDDLCGYTLTELWGRKPGEILQGEASDKETARRMSEAVTQGKPFDGRILNYSKEGGAYEVEIHFAPVRDKGGELAYFIATQGEIVAGLPLEEQKRFTQELEVLLEELVQKVEGTG
jgi:PAS domain S-box-containing protein